MSQVDAARVEIARRQEEIWFWEQRGLLHRDDCNWLVGVLADAVDALDRHEGHTWKGVTYCVFCAEEAGDDRHPWPCPDADAVICRYGSVTV